MDRSAREWAEGGVEALGVAGRREPSHGPLPVPGGLMGVFRPVVEPSVLPMLHTWHDLLLCSGVAAQFIGNEHPWNILTASQKFAKELRGGGFVAATLDQNVENISLLIDRAPQIVRVAVDREEHLVEMPRVARARTTTAQLIGKLLAKLQAPLPYGFVRHLHAACCQQFLDIPKTERESKIEPDGVANNFSRKAEALI